MVIIYEVTRVNAYHARYPTRHVAAVFEKRDNAMTTNPGTLSWKNEPSFGAPCMAPFAYPRKAANRGSEHEITESITPDTGQRREYYWPGRGEEI